MASVSDDVSIFVSSPPVITGDYHRDRAIFGDFWRVAEAHLGRLPGKEKRSAVQQEQAGLVIEAARSARKAFLRMHAGSLYARLTRNLSDSRRIEDLAYAAAAEVPGLTPTQETVARELGLMQKHKDGHEIDQGLLFNAFLADPRCGTHLCHAMLLPTKAAIERLDAFKRDGKADLGAAHIERQGSVSIVFMDNGRFLNAEDNTTVAAVETAVDLAMLDPATSIGVLRGAPVKEGKYAGQRVFSTGINLTRLYNGSIAYLWYLVRDMGWINKMFRGQSLPGVPADEVSGETHEKPWIAAVEKFAIGGGCQYLLAMDYVVAARDAYMTLPARKEGIIPGVANLRLPRFTGDRIARQAIMSERRIDCDSDTGRMICDEVIDPARMDEALMRVAASLANSGVVSAASNRRAFRVGHEPLDVFRQYMAVYAREQAICHFSPALIGNLERFWDAQNRRV